MAKNDNWPKNHKLKSPPMRKNSARTIPLKNTSLAPVKVASVVFPPSKSVPPQPMLFQASPTGVPAAKAIEVGKPKPTAKPISDKRPITGPVTLTRIRTDEKGFTTEGLNKEAVNQHMVTLPPAAELSDVRKMTVETLNNLMASEGKSQNRMIIDMQRDFAIMLFKKQFMVGEKICTIAELEFYPEQDPYRPNDEAFATAAAFYFRANPHHYEKEGLAPVFLYITAGAPGNRCGILIRSISTPEGFVEGPDKVVKYIQQGNGGDQLPALSLTDAIDESKTTGVKRFEETMIVYNGPRVGLTLREETQMYGVYCMFVMKPYRYTFCPGNLKIAKHTLAANARLDGVPDMIINRDFKLPAEILGRWITLFGRGESANLEMFLDGKNKRLEDPSQELMAHGFLSRFSK